MPRFTSSDLETLYQARAILEEFDFDADDLSAMIDELEDVWPEALEAHRNTPTFSAIEPVWD